VLGWPPRLSGTSGERRWRPVTLTRPTALRHCLRGVVATTLGLLGLAPSATLVGASPASLAANGAPVTAAAGAAAAAAARGSVAPGADGGVLSFGDARFQGSLRSTTLVKPITGLSGAPGPLVMGGA